MATVRGFDFPDDLFYLLEQDAWVRRDGVDIATIGLTSLGAHISGEFVEFMPKPLGSAIERGRSIGTLEMSKVIRSARTSVAGVIVAINEIVRAEPGLINGDPYGAGWLAKIRPTAWNEDTL